MPLVAPSALLHAHLSRSPPLRPSNRLPQQPRPIKLNVRSLTHTNGSSLVKIGATTIVCGIRAEILPVPEIPSYRASQPISSSSDPDAAIPLYNLLVPNLELATGCSPHHPASTAPSIEAQSISQRLLSLLHTSHLVPAEDLELHAPSEADIDPLDESSSDPQSELKAYYVLYIDTLCLSHGGSGSVFDAAWLAIYAALRDTILPKAEWDADEKRIVCSSDIGQATKLRLRGCPVLLSWGVFVPEQRDLGVVIADGGDGGEELDREGKVLVDMDAFEEDVCEEQGCVVVDTDEEGELVVLRMEKSGGGMVGVQEMKQLLDVAVERWREWRAVMDKAWKEAG